MENQKVVFNEKLANENISKILNPKKSIYCSCSVYLSTGKGCYFCGKQLKPIN